MKYLFSAFTFYGVFTVISIIWNYAEELELGYTIMTKTDTVVCWVLSMIVTVIILLCYEEW